MYFFVPCLLRDSENEELELESRKSKTRAPNYKGKLIAIAC